LLCTYGLAARTAEKWRYSAIATVSAAACACDATNGFTERIFRHRHRRK